MADTEIRVTYTNAGADFSPVHARLDKALPEFRGGLGKSWTNLVGGKSDSDGQVFTIHSPIDRRLALGSFVAASPRAVQEAVDAARRAQPGWAALPWKERVAKLQAVREKLHARKYELAASCLYEVGKSRLEAMGEVEEAFDLISHYCDQLAAHDGFVHPMRQAQAKELTRCVLRPVGVVGVISPFNFPMALVVNMVSAVLLGGNTAVLKPSPQGSLTASMFVAAFAEAGVAPGVINLVCGDAAGPALVDAKGVDGIAFTGSYDVGMGIFRKYANGPFARPVVAEMGGKNPTYVTAHADLDIAAKGVMRSAFGLQGQKCSSCSVVYVDRSVHDKFLEKFAQKTAALKVGNPEDKAVFVGPVVNDATFERFTASVSVAKQAGRVAIGGERAAGPGLEHGHYVQPTIVADLPADHRLVREELFMPFIAVQKCGDLAEGLRQGNAITYGLTAGIYSTRQDEVDYFLNHAEAGVLYANRASGATTGAWPGIQSFCGWKGSGITGKGGLGLYYLPQFMREQSHTLMSL